MNDTLALLLGFIALLLVSGTFSGGETALFSLDRFQVRRFERSDLRRERRVALLLARPERLLAGILLGNTLVNVAGSSVLLAFLRRVEEHLPGRDPVAMSVILGTASILLFGEILPKGLAVHAAVRLAPIIALPLEGFVRLTAPMVRILEPLAVNLLRGMGVDPRDRQGDLGRPELQLLFEETSRGDELTDDEGFIAANIFTFFETRAYEIMTPRVDLAALQGSLPPEEMRERMIEARHSRLPVYGESLDQIQGFVNSKEALLEPDLPLEALLRPVHFVPERARLHRVLAAIQGGRANLLIVVNEYGGTSGIITKEDVVEELVGEIFDEQELDEASELEQINWNRWRMAGLLSLEDLAEALKLPAPKGPAETVGGHVTHLLGRPPRTGDTVVEGALRFKVLSVRRHRAQRVLVTRLEDDASGAGGPTE